MGELIAALRRFASLRISDYETASRVHCHHHDGEATTDELASELMNKSFVELFAVVESSEYSPNVAPFRNKLRDYIQRNRFDRDKSSKVIGVYASTVLIDDAKDIQREAAELATFLKGSSVGVSLFDIGLHFEQDELAAKAWLRRFSDSKKITCEPIGKCPNDARAKLYRLSEIVDDVQNFLRLDYVDKSRLLEAMKHRLRTPKL